MLASLPFPAARVEPFLAFSIGGQCKALETKGSPVKEDPEDLHVVGFPLATTCTTEILRNTWVAHATNVHRGHTFSM